MAAESWTLDGLALTSGTFSLMELTADPPRARMDWVSAADSEAAALFRQPLHENRTITMKLRVLPQASMDVALDKVGLLVDKLRAASASPAGVSLVWAPYGSSRTCTFTVLAGEITGLPIAMSGEGYSWILSRPIVTVEMTCNPYWLGTPLATITDAFAANSIADYTFDAGAAGNVTITGGVADAAANLTTENRFLHTASPYALANAQVTLKHTLGTTLSSYKAGVIIKRVDASNYLEAYVDDTGAASRLRIDRVIAGSRTNLVSSALTRLVVSTAYWVRARIEGNVVVAEHWTSAPTATGTATTANTATLAGGDATTLGTGVTGRAGIVWTPQQTAAVLDDLEIAPNVFVSSTPFVTGEIVGVPGDVPGLGTSLLVTDRATQSRRHVEWGLEGPLTYNAATSLLVDSDDMVTTGFAGAQQSATAGAYDPNASGNTSIRSDLYSGQTTAVCGTGNLSHVGSFRVKARIYTNVGNLVRLSYQVGDGPLTTNEWATSAFESQWIEMDLGTISIPAVLSGTQRWTGRVEALNNDPAAGGIAVDYLILIPVSDGYGKARASYSYSPGVVVGQDAFAGTTAAAALNARVAPLGGTWATSGDATDFAFFDGFGFETTRESINRTTTASETSGRFAILGSTNYTDTQVDVRVWAGNYDNEAALIARWVDSSNYLRLRAPFTLAAAAAGTPQTVYLEQVVAGSVTVLAQATWTFVAGTVYRLRLLAYASGQAIGQISTDAGSAIAFLRGSSSALATGGVLDDGKPGLRDRSLTGGGGRSYTDFSVSLPAAEPIALYTGRNVQVRYDDVIRQDSTGTYSGRPPSYRGGRFLVPVGTSRVLTKARRNDIETAADDNVTDALQIQIGWTPRGLAVPR